MSIYSEILVWSADRPSWQRDALRRLLNAKLTEQDMQELLSICLADHGLVFPELPDVLAQPMSSAHVPSDEGLIGNVSIESICQVNYVSLLDSATHLEFDGSALTLIYGDNGSGKSGYAKILKKICRTRHAVVRICPNVFR